MEVITCTYAVSKRGPWRHVPVKDTDARLQNEPQHNVFNHSEVL